MNTDRTPDDIFAECRGALLGQRLTAVICEHLFTGKKLETHKQVADLIYGDLNKLSQELEQDDWIELPDGTTFQLTFKGCTP